MCVEWNNKNLAVPLFLLIRHLRSSNQSCNFFHFCEAQTKIERVSSRIKMFRKIEKCRKLFAFPRNLFSRLLIPLNIDEKFKSGFTKFRSIKYQSTALPDRKKGTEKARDTIPLNSLHMILYLNAAW
jgi:hypothetical protein